MPFIMNLEVKFKMFGKALPSYNPGCDTTLSRGNGFFPSAQINWRCFETVVLKWWPQDQQHLHHWELVRNANDLTPPQIYVNAVICILTIPGTC